MLGMITTPDLTLLFLGVIVGLGTAFVWMLWEMEQTSKQQVSKPGRDGNRSG
jgi:predicted negative regulator of RcsB-dependent stress response